MSNVENLNINNNSYVIRDANTYRSLSSTQEATLLSNGKYNDEDVNNKENFTYENGTFKQFEKKYVTESNTFKNGGIFPSTATLINVKKSGNNYIAVIDGSPTAYISSNGATWEPSTGPTNFDSSILLYNGSIAFTKTSAGGIRNYTNDNGETWTSEGDSTIIASKGCIVNNKFFGFYFSGGCNYSDDGLEWNSTSAGRTICYNDNDELYVTSVYVTGETWGNYFYTSSDLSSWTPIGSRQFDYNRIVDIGYNNSKYYALDERGKIWSSTNLTSWIGGGTTSNVGSNYTGTLMFLGNIIAFQNGNYFYYSSDGGDSFTTISIPSDTIVSLIDEEFWYINNGIIYKLNPNPHYEYKLIQLSGIKSDSSAPINNTTVGYLGQIYIDTINKDAYICVESDGSNSTYTWKQITLESL